MDRGAWGLQPMGLQRATSNLAHAQTQMEVTEQKLHSLGKHISDIFIINNIKQSIEIKFISVKK